MIQKFTKLPERSYRSGFALIATMSVMVLLVMVAMGVMSLSKSQIRSSKNDDLKMEARANARMGLLVALGELQKAVGPDQRITAPASIFENSVAQPHLVGVWNSRQQQNDEDGSIAYDRQKESDFVQWLSSSSTREHLDYNSPKSAPSNSVSLVGSGTLADPESNDSMSQYVTASKVEVTKEGALSGSYAWHVFDESLKANITVDDLQPTNDGDRIAAISTTGMPDFKTLSGLNPDYAPLEGMSDEEKEKLHSFGSSGLVGSGGTFQPRDANAFHTLTVDSRGLFIDVVNGGYQKDVSLLFEHDSLPNEFANRYIYSDSDSPLAPAPARFTHAQPLPSPDPKWSLLHDHYKMYEKVGSGTNGYTMPVSENAQFVKGAGYDVVNNPNKVLNPDFAERPQLLPVVSNAQFIFSITPQRVDHKDVNGNIIGNTLYVQFVIDPVVTLWNPYNVQIEFSDMEIELYRFPFQIEFYRNSTLMTTEPVHTANMFNSGNLGTGESWGAQNTLPYRARIQGPTKGSKIVLKPGEYKVFSPVNGTYHHQNQHYLHGLILREGYDPTAGGVSSRLMLRNNKNQSVGINRNGVGTTPFIVAEVGDVYSARVSASKLKSDVKNAGFPETNMQEVAAFLKIFQGDGGGRSNTSGLDNVKRQLDAARTQIGSIEVDMSAGKLGQVLPTYGPNEMSQLTIPAKTSINSNIYRGKVPLMIASLRLKTENDSATVPGAPNASQWLHNGITNPYFTSGVTDVNDNPADQNEDDRTHQYELTWEPMTSWNNIPTVELDNQNRGYGGSGISSATGQNAVTFSQIPLTSSTSMAQLVHAPLNAGGQAPLTTQIVGNSFSSPLIPLAKKSNSGTLGEHLDHSYMANTTLFNHYFMSGLASESGPIYGSSGRSLSRVVEDFFSGKQSLRNPKIVVEKGISPNISESDYPTVAQYLYNKGAFNVNSTSVNAWALFLASGTDESLPMLELLAGRSSLATSNTSTDIAVSRFAPLLGELVEGSDDGPSRWAGHRRLTRGQIIQLAEHVVEQVQKRGPFQSLSEFVNRQLSDDSELSNAGTLQSAIEEAGMNKDFGEDAPRNIAELEAAAGTANTSDGAPTQITQADLLTRIAPSITVRGDTFKIRAYGEATDGKNTARAWCEAVVQRDHDFSDPSQPSTTDIGSLNEVNQELGRRFQVLSYRWLTESEL